MTITSRELVEEVGCSYRQVHYWATVKGVLPIAKGGGSGNRLLFEDEAVRIARALHLTADLRMRGDLTKAVTEAVRDGRSHVDLGGGVRLDWSRAGAAPPAFG